jgi:hypothetical protein
MRMFLENASDRPAWYEVDGKRGILEPRERKEVPPQYWKTVIVPSYVTRFLDELPA